MRTATGVMCPYVWHFASYKYRNGNNVDDDVRLALPLPLHTFRTPPLLSLVVCQIAIKIVLL